MKVKKKTIGRKILAVMLAISMLALLASMIVSISNMWAIRNIFIDTNETLGNEAASSSEEALISQMTQNIQTLVENKSSANAASTLGEYLNTIQNLADYITTLYREPEAFKLQNVQEPKVENGGIYTLQRYITRDTKEEDIKEEADLLGNVQYIFDPVIRSHQEVITTIYLATESGILLSYDTDSNLAENSYYDFKDRDWYQRVKEEQAALYTDAYKGAYGWGLMTTCAAPFYGADGAFAGVVCIDMQLKDIQNEIVNVDISDSSKAWLVDRKGNMIAGPGVDYSTETFTSLSEWNSSPEFVKAIPHFLIGLSGVTEINSVFYAYAPVKYVDWILLIAVPRDDIIQPVNEMHQSIIEEMEHSKSFIGQRIQMAVFFLIAVMVASLLVILYVAVKLTKKLVEPIQRVQQQVRIVSSGDLETRVEVKSDDEIGALAEDFNYMALSLKEQINAIRKVTAEKERISAELGVAAQIQADMLPNIFPAFPEREEFEIYASMTPAKEVGGDFYDFFLVDEEHLAVVIADVSGKGVPAALFMVIAKTLIKDAAQMGIETAEIFTQVNEKLCEANDEGMFVTAWLGILEISTGKMVYVNAGHNPPLVKHGNQEFEYLKQKPGFVLAGIEEMVYQSSELILNQGDTLFLYTDGVTEAINLSEEMYGEDRLKEVLNDSADLASELILLKVQQDINKFVGTADQFDDITMLALQMKSE